MFEYGHSILNYFVSRHCGTDSSPRRFPDGLHSDQPLVVKSGENAALSWLAWKQMDLYVQLSCPECGGRGKLETIICSHPEMIKLDSCCWRCGRPLLGEVIFI